MLLEESSQMHFPDEESGELAEAQWLRQYVGKLGYIQLGFAHQGIMTSSMRLLQSGTSDFNR